MQRTHHEMKRYQVVALCSGIGGSIIGYKHANMDVRVAIDHNEASTHVIRNNYHDILVLWQAIEDTKGDDLHLICKGELDVLDVAIPSRYLYHRPNEPLQAKHNFLMQLARIVHETQPKITVIHFDNRFNKGRHRMWVNECIELMKEVGYEVHVEIMKSSLFGIPNEKEWGLAIGVRKDIGIKPVFPETHDVDVSTKGAIGDLMDDEADIVVNPTRLSYVKRYFYPGISYKEVKQLVSDLELPIHPAYYRRDRWDEPFYPLFGTTVRPFHPLVDRLLTLKEAKRLQTFPDDYLLTNHPIFDWKEVCSSVPPVLIHCVADSLKNDILRYLS